ncbi:Arginine biosynthesis protein ArgJ like protein, partial [Aduncisulcus paluster]
MDFSIKYEAVDVEGFFSHGIHCGIKSTDPKRDLGVIFCPDAVSAAGVFTQNVAKAAPVTLSQLHLKENQIKAIVVNSGNANACTGEQGAKDALSMCHAAADALHIQKSQVLVASTGIIGVPMPMDKILPGIKTLCADVKEDGLK